MAAPRGEELELWPGWTAHASHRCRSLVKDFSPVTLQDHKLHCHLLDLNPGTPHYRKDIGSLGGNVVEEIKPFKPVLDPVPSWGPLSAQMLKVLLASAAWGRGLPRTEPFICAGIIREVYVSFILIHQGSPFVTVAFLFLHTLTCLEDC